MSHPIVYPRTILIGWTIVGYLKKKGGKHRKRIILADSLKIPNLEKPDGSIVPSLHHGDLVMARLGTEIKKRQKLQDALEEWELIHHYGEVNYIYGTK